MCKPNLSMNHAAYKSILANFVSSVAQQNHRMKSVFLISVTVIVIALYIENAISMPISTIGKKSLVTNTGSGNVNREVISNIMDPPLTSVEEYRTKREIMNKIGCPKNMVRIITCVPKR